MPGLNLNIGTSVFKREVKSMEKVTNQLKRNGWEQTGSLGERVKYFENSRFNVTVIDGPAATVVIPSGPIRGRLFGDSGLMANQTSVIGAGSDTGDNMTKQDSQAKEKVNQIT